MNVEFAKRTVVGACGNVGNGLNTDMNVVMNVVKEA